MESSCLLIILITEEKLTRKRNRDESHDMLADYIKRLKSAAVQTDQSESQSAIECIRREIQSSENPFIQSLITA